MKKKLTAVALIVCMLAIMLVGASLAYFTDTETADNTFTVGSVEIELNEPAWKATGEKDAPQVYPGEKLDKDPQVKNIGENPCLVRIKVEGLDSLKDYCKEKAADADKLITIEGLNTTDWKQEGDYYYYLKPLDKDATTPALFAGIRMPYSLENLPEGTTNDFGVKVTAEAVQAQGAFPSYSTIADGISEAELATVVSFFATALAE